MVFVKTMPMVFVKTILIGEDFYSEQEVYFWIWGITPVRDIVINPFYYYALILFWIGFFLNFINIKPSYREYGYISAFIVFTSIILLYLSTHLFAIDFDKSSLDYWNMSYFFGGGFVLSIILGVLILFETFFLTYIKKIKNE